MRDTYFTLPSPSQVLAALIGEETKALDEAARAAGLGELLLSADWMRQAQICREKTSYWAGRA